jgi:hypothetical protein
MVYFQTKNPNLGKFWRVLQWKMLVYFMTIWSILLPFGLFYCHLVYFIAIRYILWLFIIFFQFGMLYEEKSGNPVVVLAHCRPAYHNTFYRSQKENFASPFSVYYQPGSTCFCSKT